MPSRGRARRRDPPAGDAERLERHTIGISESAARLRAAGRHLKRGVLLHGPPGTGKTLSTMYLLHAMAGRTTIVLTGRGLGLIEQAMDIGRELAPATFVFEDIDLVAAERTMEFGSERCCLSYSTRWRGWPRMKTCCSC